MKLKSIPIYGSLYPEPPYIYHGTRLILVLFQVDKNKLVDVIPEGLKLPSGKNTTVMAFFADYVKSSIGQYYEAATLIDVKCESKTLGKVRGFYCNSMFVDSDTAMAAGREIWGFPKKLAKIQLIEKGNQVIGTLERRNIEIMKMTLDLENDIAELPMPDIPIITFRQFFAPGGGDYSLKQFQKIPMELEPDKIKSGNLKLEFKHSEEDPLSVFESGSESVVTAVYIKLKRGVLPWGKLL
ncbi:MAG: hypothetical protein EAX96_19255 [Candidatus Lokiarchaeota archaeon]|nr:hypothetical protein [Candidatus Lokiarchaeota archaeon]